MIHVENKGKLLRAVEGFAFSFIFVELKGRK